MQNDPSTQPAAAEPVPSHATGPRTEAGKAISSQNARKHGLCSRTLRLSPEGWAEYNDIRDGYARDLQPVGDVEETLVDEICFNYWRLQQTREGELDIIEQHPTALALIALYIRYRTGYERAFYKALDQIQKRQRDRRKQAGSAAAPVAAAPLAPLCSEESQAGCAESSTAEVRSANSRVPEEIAEAALELEDRLATHLLENRVRAKQQLSPIELPEALASRLHHFVSQNPGVLPQQLLDGVKKAA